MPPAGFERAIPAGDRPQKLALDRSATGIGTVFKYEIIMDIQLSLKKTALYPVLISKMPGIFSLLTCHYQL